MYASGPGGHNAIGNSTLPGMDEGYESNTAGAIIAVVASVISILGTNMQKRSHNINDVLPQCQRRPYHLRPFWWLGLIGVILGAMGDFAALGYASQSLVAALGGGTTLIGNVFFGSLWNGEEILTTDMVGVVSVICGAIAFAVTTPKAESYTLQELEERFQSPGFVAYAGVQACVISALLGTIAKTQFYKWRAKATNAAMKPVVYKLNAALTAAVNRLEAVEARLDVLESVQPAQQQAVMDLNPIKHPKLQSAKAVDSKGRYFGEEHWSDQYIYAACAGCIGAMSVLFASCVGKLILTSLHDENQFNRLTPYVFVALMLASVVTQTHYLNMGLMAGDTMSVFPVFQVFWIGFSVVGGVVFYRQGFVSAIGIFFMMLGVYFLVKHGKSSRHTAANRTSSINPSINGEGASLNSDLRLRLAEDAVRPVEGTNMQLLQNALLGGGNVGATVANAIGGGGSDDEDEIQLRSLLVAEDPCDDDL